MKKLKPCPIIKDLTELKQLASREGGIETFIALNFGLRSSKHIEYNGEDKWYIFNEIDDTEQSLTTEELATHTNIIEAIDKGSLYLSHAV